MKKGILAMEAGEKFDRLVATEVMGEPIPEFTPEAALGLNLAGDAVKSPQGNWLCLCEYDKGDIPIWHPLQFSTDISAAWQVVEKMRAEWNITMITGSLEVSRVAMHPLEGAISAAMVIEVNTTGMPESICKAALLARRAKHESKS